MKTKFLLAFALIFAVAFVFGCTGGGGDDKAGSGSGYTINVNPTQVVSEGVITVDLRLKNIFEKEMTGVTANMVGLPKGGYSGADSSNVGIIVANQEFPVIWTIGTPSTELKQTITPTVEVCFNYTTNFFFDAALKNKTAAAETVTLQTGASNGPITVSQAGLDNIFLKDNNTATAGTGSINIQNSWQGSIRSINNVSITVDTATTSSIKNATVGYAKCGGTTASITPSSPNATDCAILKNELAIGNGITAKATINIKPTASISSIEIERVNGIVAYTYCYDIDVGEITVCPVGQRC